MRKMRVIVRLLFGILLVYVFWSWDSVSPLVRWQGNLSNVGRDTQIVIEVEDQGRGLLSLEIVLARSGQEKVMALETYDAFWPWEKGIARRSIELSPAVSFGEEWLSEGEFVLQVTATDQPNLWFWSRHVSEQRTFTLDLTPPRITVVSKQHYVRQGGSEAILYEVSKDTVASGVQVGQAVFTGYRLPERGEQTYICLLALAHDDSPETEMRLWAQDAAGNRGENILSKEIIPVRFRRRQIILTDSLMNTVVPEILEHTQEVSGQETLLETFLKINGPLRQINNGRVQKLSQQSANRILWSEPFSQLSNSQVESAFADHRTYYYQGKAVDQQTHLGFDLASIARSQVESANEGIVLFADYLGIYGNTVIVDHGLGLLSLYGHLSNIDVHKGERVQKDQRLGFTGQSGLAAGDHLHFSLFLHGVQVNPLEWWDPCWVNAHILDRIR